MSEKAKVDVDGFWVFYFMFCVAAGFVISQLRRIADALEILAGAAK